MSDSQRRRLVSEPLLPRSESFASETMTIGAPLLPRAFVWGTSEIIVAEVAGNWTSNRVDRGDAYRDRHWFEFRTPDGRVVVVYFDRHARRGRPRWWLYSIAEAASEI